MAPSISQPDPSQKGRGLSVQSVGYSDYSCSARAQVTFHNDYLSRRAPSDKRCNEIDCDRDEDAPALYAEQEEVDRSVRCTSTMSSDAAR